MADSKTITVIRKVRPSSANEFLHRLMDMRDEADRERKFYLEELRTLEKKDFDNDQQKKNFETRTNSLSCASDHKCEALNTAIRLYLSLSEWEMVEIPR